MACSCLETHASKQHGVNFFLFCFVGLGALLLLPNLVSSARFHHRVLSRPRYDQSSATVGLLDALAESCD